MPTEPAADFNPLRVASTCCVKGCREPAPWTPVLQMAQCETVRVSEVPLPVHLCADHRGDFPDLFLTAGRRATMEGSLRSRGRAAPDWSRTTVRFVKP